MSNIILYNESLIINIINNSYFPITSRINLTANSNSFDLVHDIDLNDSSFRIV